MKSGNKRIYLNIGIVVFALLFAYLVITLVIYLTRDRVEIYQVTRGTLAKDERYTALALRREEVVRASENGYLNFFVQDGTRIGKGEAVCVISENADPQTYREVDERSLAAAQRVAMNYQEAYDANRFGDVYELKYALEQAAFGAEKAGDRSGAVYSADRDGIIAYSADGYESMTAEGIQASDFQPKSYERAQLSADKEVEADAPIYRLITSDDWSLVLPLSERQAEVLKDREQIDLRFIKDDKIERGELRIFTSDGASYAEITMTDGLIRYCKDRFLDVELLTNTTKGLKIPRTALVEKAFYTIPKAYATEGGSEDALGFLVERRDEKSGETKTEFVDATIYEERTNEADGSAVYLVDTGSFSEGDVVLMPDSEDRYTISKQQSLTGVYCTNKGYAVFRKVEILDMDEESCVLAVGTGYGIAQYDFIVRDAKDVQEEEIIYAASRKSPA